MKITTRLLLIISVCAALCLSFGAAAAQDSQNVTPETLLLAADRYLLNGYYETAVAGYQMVLNGGDAIAPEQRAAAYYGLGQAALREGFFSDAVNALSLFIEQFPDDSRAANARFLRGDAYLGLSLWEQALADFQTYMTLRPGVLDSYALERSADALLALGRQEEALDTYKRAATASRSNVPLAALRERVAQIYLATNRYVEALEQYDAILTFAENNAYRALIEFAAANTALAAEGGSGENGNSRMAAIFNTYPDTPQAYEAMLALERNGIALDNLARGRVSFNFGDYERAIQAFTTYSAERPLTEVPAELHLLLGRAYREIGNFAAANTAFQTIVDAYPTDPLFGTALLEQGRTRFTANDINGAITQYLFVADNYGYLPEAAEALWRAGYLYATNDNATGARQIFERLADSHPDSQQAIDGLFLAASEAYRVGDNAAAERYYAEIGSKAAGEDQAQALLQVGRLAMARGDGAIAQTAFQQASQAAPDSYYAARARDIINGIPAFARPANVQFQFDDAVLIAEAEDWLRASFNLTQPSPLWQLSPTLENDLRLIRGRELWQVAAYDEARAEFDELLTAYETDPLASYQLAIFLRGLAAYQDSIVAAANIIRAAGVGTLDVPRYVARMRYPAYYLDAVLESTGRYNLDPLLLFSLIRLESLFDTFATAAAGERGLTQVIPSTAEYIAGELGYTNFQGPELFRPYVGVEFGAFYLSEQLGTFDGNASVALSGYNAGPGRAFNWMALSGGDHDLLLTTIDIDSTRGYVQRIYGFYNIYRALYGV
jgi:soluble lytic murein transglycosylase